MTEKQQTELSTSIEILRKRHHNYGVLYQSFARLKIITTRTNDNHVDGQGEDNNGDDGVEEYVDRNNEESMGPDTVQVLDPNSWEKYLKLLDWRDADSDQSPLNLQAALDLTEPLEQKAALWLFKLRDCALFMNKVWRPSIESANGTYPFCQKDLEVFVGDCSARWINLALSVAEETTSFREMEEIVTLQPDPISLTQIHLRRSPIAGVKIAYQNFKHIQELRHLIGPFTAALRFFRIRDQDSIDELYEFATRNVQIKGDETTLAEVTEAVIVRVLKDKLNIDPDRPETRNAMQFISSLVTEGNNSPLIEWLNEKTEKDMEAMGKILQGGLLEAYGNYYGIPGFVVVNLLI